MSAERDDTEECLFCSAPLQTVTAEDDIALCQGHWNAWLARFLGDGLAPCAAHLIEEK